MIFDYSTTMCVMDIFNQLSLKFIAMCANIEIYGKVQSLVFPNEMYKSAIKTTMLILNISQLSAYIRNKRPHFFHEDEIWVHSLYNLVHFRHGKCLVSCNIISTVLL